MLDFAQKKMWPTLSGNFKKKYEVIHVKDVSGKRMCKVN
jgi:hypothetical protein